MADNPAPQDIAQRTTDFALRIIKLYRHIEKDSIGRILGKQLLRSGTSVGANVQESRGAQSRADFIAKMSIAHKEILETNYWLRLLRESEIVPASRLTEIMDEATQLSKIIAAILITSKKNR